MKIIKTPIKGVFEVEGLPFIDKRGSFLRLYDSIKLKKLWKKRKINQVNQSASHTKGTVRGVHFQYVPDTEAKLVRCLKGKVFDVAVDLRPNSPTFLKWHGVELSQKKANALFVPEGCGQGYQSLVSDIHVIYFHSGVYVPSNEGALRWDDGLANINWPLKSTIVSKRDKGINPLKSIIAAKKIFKKFSKFYE
jgi:dTDP-4-dehydrorhamnose 3,5-epimerase